MKKDIAANEVRNEEHLEFDLLTSLTKEIAMFRATLNMESDRGCALMAASYLEGKVRDILRSIYADDAALVEGVLNRLTFADAVNQVYLLGLLPEKMKRDIGLIRKIRNEFAHTESPVNFETGSIADRCHCLYHASRVSKKIGDIRSQFTSAAISIALCLMYERAERHHATIPDDIDYDEPSSAPQLAVLLTREVYESLKKESMDSEQSAHWDALLEVFDSIENNDISEFHINDD